MKASNVPAAAQSKVALPERPALHEVRLTLQPMLRIRGCALEDPTSTVFGELLGLEIESGVMEITNCYSCQNISPTRPAAPAAVPADSSAETTTATATAAATAATSVEEKTLEKYRSKVRDLHDSVDADPQASGIWTSEPVSDLNATLEAVGVMLSSRAVLSLNTLLEDLYERSQTVEPNTILLTFDKNLHQTGEFAFKAYRLAEEWFDLRRQLDRGEIEKRDFTKAVASLECSPLTSVRCIPSLTPYDQAVINLCHPAAEAQVARDQSIQEALMQTRERELARINYALENAVNS